MVSEKVLHFVGKNKDLNQLSQQIVQYLKNDGYKTQATAPQGMIIQAQKAGILRDIITADRAFTIIIITSNRATARRLISNGKSGLQAPPNVI